MKRVLITGKNSYIGTAVEKWLCKNTYFRVDTLDMKQAAWRDYDFSGYDAVFHVAGIAHADVERISEQGKQLYYRVNTQLAEETAIKAKESGVKQFIYMSTMIIYGGCGKIGEKKVINRNTVPSPENFYGNSKWEGEQKVRALEDNDFKVAVLRPPMIYGKECKGNYGILEKIALKIPVFPKIENERSVLHIDKFCANMEEIILREKNGIFFPQDDEYIKTYELIEQIAESHNKKVYITKALNPFVYLASRIPHKKLKGMLHKAFGSIVYEKENSDEESIDTGFSSLHDTTV